ncbi:hypothetical protein [Ramlibacter tataouinensis]|uniref:Candidate membrane protein n=1 Tax=Ramlibacter tataouinensis (strain ATCC BAA-407 / DSM 14655 / LMG 21543 / TTB310) TaxID=365046 RepID=F5Y4F9_RAMTT|nr:hypothetical protein [Ramlibacter tataouinensis]AEG93806.1 candidate membrane protein [Ramlibacter tataouinensis TTB310]
MSHRFFFTLAFVLGLLALAWVGLGFVGTSWLALAMTVLIAAVYGVGAFELRQFRAATAALHDALEQGLATAPAALPDWLERVPAALRPVVRLRIEGERGVLPGPALTPYLAGLLVMLGMLGTFLGMVVTFQGAVFALQGSTDLQAIRSSLAEPIRGLGLSFGTSVAGVAASAMLGLMSAISRRERGEVARLLDTRVATVLRPFSATQHRQETLLALQAQARALPEVVQALHATMERIERRSEQLDTRLLERQAQLQREVTAACTGLAQQVGASLQDHLAAGTQAAGAAIRPVVEQAMAQVVGESRQLYQRLGEVAQASGQQRTAIEAMVGSAATALAQAHDRFAQTLQAQAAQAADVSAQAAGSAVELASLAEAFGASVQQFQSSQDRLAETLQRVEASLQRSTARSDEQLAYYVAQAREVIELSVASQQAVMDSLRQLQQGKARPLAESVA